MSLAHAIGRQLACPEGWAGRLIGPAMTLANRRPTRAALAALAVRPGERALDLGCGAGEAVALMARAGAHVTGVDRAPAMIDQAARRNARAIAAGQVVLHRAAFDALPLPDAGLDAILAANVAYFWHDAAPVVAEMHRVLRPGGRLAVYVTAAETMRNWAFAGPETHRHWDAAGLAAALSAPGGFAPGSVAVRALPLPFGARGLVAIAVR